MMQKTDLFELVTDTDMQTTESYDHMIMYCKTCKCFFSQKACGMRNIFPSNTLYCPTDGNARIAEVPEEHRFESFERKMAAYDCDVYPVRINTIADLNAAIEHFNG